MYNFGEKPSDMNKVKALLKKVRKLLTPSTSASDFVVVPYSRPCFFLCEWLYILRPDISDISVRAHLIAEIEESRSVSKQVRVETLTEKIPDEYIGILEIRREGQLISRSYLLPVTKYVAKIDILTVAIEENNFEVQ